MLSGSEQLVGEQLGVRSPAGALLDRIAVVSLIETPHRNLAGDGQRRAFTPALILFIALPDPHDKSAFEVHAFPLALLPRRCPHCAPHHHRPRPTAQAGPRRTPRLDLGTARPLPSVWRDLHHPSLLVVAIWPVQPSWEPSCNRGGAWEQAAPQCKDPNRFPDPATLRRWACRRLLSLCCSVKAFWFGWPGWQTFWRAPTILAWDWAAIQRNLHLEANSP
jgi:hypothetical protein